MSIKELKQKRNEALDSAKAIKAKADGEDRAEIIVSRIEIERVGVQIVEAADGQRCGRTVVDDGSIAQQFVAVPTFLVISREATVSDADGGHRLVRGF